jgi:hypothetical protein
MKKQAPLFLALLFAVIFSMNSRAFAADSYGTTRNGLGIAIGEPGGITFFHKISERSFMQAFISRYLLIGADYAVMFPRAIYSIPELTPFVGGGAFLFTSRHWDHSRDVGGVGMRIPLGLLLQVPNAPIQFHA